MFRYTNRSKAENSYMNSRIGGCSFIHPHLTLPEGLATIKRLGFESVDIGFGGANGHYRAAEVAQSPLHFANQVHNANEKTGLHINECFVLNFGQPINSPNPDFQRQTRELFGGLCQFAKAANFVSVMLIPGPIHEELGQQHSLDLAVNSFNELVPIAAAHGLGLNVETDVDSCANTPEVALELCQRVPGLTLTLDHSHFICQGIAPGRAECLYPYTRHYHVRQAAPGQIVAEVDSGTIDFANIISQLEAGGYAGLYCVEYLTLSADTSAATSEARTLHMKRELEHLLGEA
jgi:sugar phosphate isomerase/epimerase